MKDEKKAGEPFPHQEAQNEAADQCRSDSVGEAENKELSSLLKKWHAPGTPPSLDIRVAASFHRQVIVPPLWKRLLTARIPVPVPAAAIVILLLSATSFLALHTTHLRSAKLQEIISTTAQTKAPEVLISGRTEITPEKAPSSIVNRSAEAARAIAERTPIPKMASGNPAKSARKVYAITLQDDQGTMHCVTDTEYRLIPVPKIFAGSYFNPSEIR